MKNDPLAQIKLHETKQSEPATPDQVKNAAGGFVFEISELSRLQRFLMLGTDGGTYYITEKELTKDNARFIFDLAKKNPAMVVNEIVAISQAGRAPRQNPALFSLAVVASVADREGRRLALNALPQVARTGTHLFTFVGYVENLRGWGRGLREAVAKWYNDKPVDKLVYQILKYRQRNGWTHRDLLRLSHPKPKDPIRNTVYSYAVGKALPDEYSNHQQIQAFEGLKTASVDRAIEIISSGIANISWEMLPDRLMNEPKIWEALFEQGIPVGALIRQLPRLTRIGLLSNMSEFTTHVITQMTDSSMLKLGRQHPINLLVAQRTYALGHGKGSAWTPVSSIVDALDDAFYKSFDIVEPTNKRLMIALDVSGSMEIAIPKPGGRENYPLTNREASAALAMAVARSEPVHEIVGFTTANGRSWRYSSDNSVMPLDISPRRRLDDIVRYTSGLSFGGTDVALPMLYALKNSIPVDAFVVYTDNESWAGDIHPFEALKKYRQATGINAKVIVCAMSAVNYSVADPDDPGMLDVVGFDSTLPTIVNTFIKDSPVDEPK